MFLPGSTAEKFLKLQSRITELEDEIADRREYYNDSVNTFNIRIQQIPDTFVAFLMNLTPRPCSKWMRPINLPCR
jgi:LemA protein